MPETPARRSTRWPILAVVATALGMLLTLPEPVSAQPARPTAEVPSLPADQAPGHRILLLYGEPRLTPAIVAQDAILRSVLTDRSSVPMTFYTEYLDLNLFDGTVPLPELRELLRRKYETRHIDLIVTGGSRVLRIALHNRAELFSNAPIVFLGVDPTAAADLRLDRGRHRDLAPHGVGGDAQGGAPPAARHPAGRRGRRRLTDRPCLDGGGPQSSSRRPGTPPRSSI